MDLRRDQQRIARAPAKLNLYLDVLGRRDDGYHELETLMLPVRLWDDLSFVPAFSPSPSTPAEIHLTLRDGRPAEHRDSTMNSVPASADNLVVKALAALRQQSGCTHGAHVTLTKRIPAAAGLGGGSSDAAAALVLANCAWGLNWDLARLSAVAAQIGSDVPFFLTRQAAVCRGRGERVARLPGLPPLHFVVVKPPADLSTAAVYQRLAAQSHDQPTEPCANLQILIDSLRRARLAAAARHLRNALQSAASALSPWVDRLQHAFNRLDVLGHQLSGSGSAYFALCRHAAHARRLASILKSQGLGHVYALRSCP